MSGSGMSRRDAPPRLGRGLAALLGENTVHPNDALGGPPQSIGIELLEPGPFQPRGPIEDESLNELADSIRVHGILQPILVRPHPTEEATYQIIAGERRWRAAQRAGLHEVPAFIRKLSNNAAMAAALVENLQREDLNAIEEAEGYRRLLDEFGLTQEALGTAVGKSRSHVANTMRLLNLPATVQAEVRKGTLSAGHARALLAHPEPAKAALAVLAGGLNVRQTEALASRKAATAPPESAPLRKDPNIAAMEHELSGHLGMRVDIDSSGNHGRVRIRFTSLDQLDGLIALLMSR